MLPSLLQPVRSGRSTTRRRSGPSTTSSRTRSTSRTTSTMATMTGAAPRPATRATMARSTRGTRSMSRWTLPSGRGRGRRAPPSTGPGLCHGSEGNSSPCVARFLVCIWHLDPYVNSSTSLWARRVSRARACICACPDIECALDARNATAACRCLTSLGPIGCSLQSETENERIRSFSLPCLFTSCSPTFSLDLAVPLASGANVPLCGSAAY